MTHRERRTDSTAPTLLSPHARSVPAFAFKKRHPGQGNLARPRGKQNPRDERLLLKRDVINKKCQKRRGRQRLGRSKGNAMPFSSVAMGDQTVFPGVLKTPRTGG